MCENQTQTKNKNICDLYFQMLHCQKKLISQNKICVWYSENKHLRSFKLQTNTPNYEKYDINITKYTNKLLKLQTNHRFI